MGLLGDIGRGLAGAVTGLATAGPLGAGAGLVSGLMTGSSAGRTTNVNNVSTRQTQLRKWTDDEARVVDSVMQRLGLAVENMNPADAEATRQEIYDRLYGLRSQEIKDNFSSRAAEDYANRASRGAANTSAGNVQADRRAAMESRELGRASTESDIASREIGLREQAGTQAAINSYLGTLGQMWQQRLQGSKIVQTGSGVTMAPDTFLPSISAGLGYAVGNEDSYLNTHGFLGMGGGNKPASNPEMLIRSGILANSLAGIP